MPLVMSYNRIAAAMIAAMLCLVMLTGCTEKEPEGGDMVFTVISDGQTVDEVTEQPDTSSYEELSDTELYIPEHMETRFSSLNYNSRMKEVYNDVVETVLGFKEKSYMPLTISTEEYVRILETVRCEQLMMFFLESRTPGDFDVSKHTFEMNFTYKYSISETNRMLRETEAAAKEIVALTDDTMSDYEKLKVFHDYLAINVESSTDDPYADSVYGALVKKQALCEGYAKAFSYLCNIVGIENMIVTGYTDVDHMWNMVKLGDSWYHVDVGWDKPSAALQELYPDMVLYQYFLTDDYVIKNNRLISGMLGDIPKADSTEMNYFIKENRYASTYEEVLDIIENACGKCIDSGEKYFMLKLDTSNLYLQTTANLIKPDNDGISDIDRIVERLNFKGKISYIDYYKNYRIIIFVLE